ncbi:unnamed protein product [Hymenolepis diminuta]|uniref:DAGKc domain-containing protein n=1 Tax=Hymenolepis diminuta TaxID=6216 RepID=A0A3P6ZHF8_HYMDI|nr:unnamed protein product [Hymenolepis diminuta]
MYALKDLLCVHCLTSSSSVVNKQFIPCLLLSKHYPDGYPAKVVVNKDGIHMTGRSQPVSNSLLISWNCILRWQQMRLSTSSSVFRVYIVGLVHPCTPDDPEASNILLINQKLKIKDEDTNVKIPAGHSFKIDGFAHDASLDFCCLIISLDNRSDCDAISTAFQNYALCDSKDREYRGHACDYIQELPLSELKKYRALVYVSGDGVLHELVNGLFSRGDVTSFPLLACIPAGSGNAMASAICYRSGISTQRNLLKSCGILLALPNSPDSFIPHKPSVPFQLKSYWQMHKPMILEADNWTQPRLCSVAVSWGFISEVDLRSDFMRILGSVRFQIIFAYLLMSNLVM